MLDKNIKAFIVCIAFFTLAITIYLTCKAKIALLLAKKVTVLAKYLDFADVFLKKLAKVLPKQTGVIESTSRLEKRKQLVYEPIYSQRFVEFDTSKTCIEINLANSFIKALKLSAGTLIHFICKCNGNLYLYVN